MALDKYSTPTELNKRLISATMLGNHVYGEDALDKNNSTEYGDIAATAGAISMASDLIASAAGYRAPMYVIGEIENDNSINKNSAWVPSAVKGLVRAVTDIVDGNKQEGVIIDGLGDANGSFSVEFTSNPVLFRANNIIDNRYRAPSVLKMTIMVSNYLSDNLGGMVTDVISSLDPTGLVDEYRNAIAYGGNTRAQWALYKLRWLMENAQPFTVHTPHGVYENMVIKRLSPQTTENTMDMLYCDVEFQELILYAPYSDDIGKIPARAGITKVRKGWTLEAIKNANALW